jgi:hypothetical protein
MDTTTIPAMLTPAPDDTKSFSLYGRRFVLGDINSCSKSERTFDIPLFDLANNEKLLNKLHLYYMQGNYGARYTFESRAKWFCGYFDSLLGDEEEIVYKKLLTNPVLRLLVTDAQLLEDIKIILKK